MSHSRRMARYRAIEFERIEARVLLAGDLVAHWRAHDAYEISKGHVFTIPVIPPWVSK